MARANSTVEQDAEAKAKADAEAQAKAEAEAKAKADAEAQARADADAKALAEAEAQAKAEAEAQAAAGPSTKTAADVDSATKNRANIPTNAVNETSTGGMVMIWPLRSYLDGKVIHKAGGKGYLSPKHEASLLVAGKKATDREPEE